MDGDTNISQPAKLMSEPTRASMLMALIGGKSLPASELARIAGVSAPTASSHLNALVTGGFLEVRNLGRHRYFELANDDVAHAIEALQAIAPRNTITSYNQSATAQRLATARTCYDHLAGALAVTLSDSFTSTGTIDALIAGKVGHLRAPVLTPVAQALNINAFRPHGRRPVVRGCLDWTERRPHIAGQLGAHVLQVLLLKKWLTAVTGERGLNVSSEGREGLAVLGLHVRLE
ncbi:helix-turn-helix transcriptional regulator [Arthrobacter sp. CAN_C5]|uniref:ArsR/SmtB family transcription factor n=1 Tax=Arthrobacter sp. CAN_C5 TaxID=2760706 RepID=UPI001AE70F08|nr:helix-turn-helix transcriptional regulator [Arthrobacter sp. CAN_C5]MBP2217042.1 DNA-binding transcriptional ArsR family regulator [Arthrobacter sp. CAN_C5]